MCFGQIKRWFSVEAEKHLASLDSLSFNLSSLQEMRQSLEQFTEEAAVRDLRIMFVCWCAGLELVCQDGTVCRLFKLSVTMFIFTVLFSAPAEAGRSFDAGPQPSVQFYITGAQAAHELRPPASTRTQDRAGHPNQPLRVLRHGIHTQPVDGHNLHIRFYYLHLYNCSL